MAILKKSIILNQERLNKKFKFLPNLIIKEVKKSVLFVGKKVERDAKISIQTGSRSGKISRRGKSSFVDPSTGRSLAKKRGGALATKLHQASAPGEVPKSDSGDLAKGIFSELELKGLGSKIGTNIEHGTHLEFGTKKMLPRPWLMPAFENNKKDIVKAITGAFRKGIKKGTVRFGKIGGV